MKEARSVLKKPSVTVSSRRLAQPCPQTYALSERLLNELKLLPLFPKHILLGSVFIYIFSSPRNAHHLDGIFGHVSLHVYIPYLTHPVNSVDGLGFDHGVPVRFQQMHIVGCHETDAKLSSVI